MTFSQWINTSEPFTDIDKFINDIDTKIASIRSILSSDVSNISHKEMVIEQYKTCVWFLSDFFSFTRNHYWEEDGIWSCRIEESISEIWIEWPFRDDIIKIRSKLKPKKKNIYEACIFHKQKFWCVLWDVKSPLCVAFPDGSLPEIYDDEKFFELLLKILFADMEKDSNIKREDVMNNWNIVIVFLEEVKKNTLALKSL